MSHIEVNEQGKVSALVGPDATRLMHVITVRQGIAMYIDTGGRMILTRGATIGNLLKLATKITGKPYKVRSDESRKAALQDLDGWIATMKAALPVVNAKGEQV